MTEISIFKYESTLKGKRGFNQYKTQKIIK